MTIRHILLISMLTPAALAVGQTTVPSSRPAVGAFDDASGGISQVDVAILNAALTDRTSDPFLLRTPGEMIWRYDSLPNHIFKNPTQRITAGHVTAGVMTAGQATAGQSTAGEVTASQMTAGQMTTGEVTSGKMTAGYITSGRTMTAGRVTSGTITSGQITAGQVTSGQITNGQVTGGCVTGSR